MRGSNAEYLDGICYVNNELAAKPFPTMSASILTCTTQLAAPITEQSAYCDDTIIFRWGPGKSKTAYPYATDFGYGGTDFVPIKLDDSYLFDYQEVEKWNPKIVTPVGALPEYTISLEGPRWLNPSSYIPLKELKLPLDEDERKLMLLAFRNVDWLDNQTNSMNIGPDWLGIAWPGGWLYCPEEMPTPFHAYKYYEDSGRELDWEQNKYHMWQLPFCEPLSIYNNKNNLTGKFNGLAFIPFFSTGFLKEPFCGKPVDLSLGWDPENQQYPTRLRSTVQYINIELWIYAGLKAEEGEDIIKSPRIARIRWWFFTQPDGAGEPAPNVPFEPYLFLQCGQTPVGPKWLFPFDFKLKKGETNPSSLQTLITRLSLSNFGLRLGA